MSDREAMKLALDALELWRDAYPKHWNHLDEQAEEALRTHLAAPRPEPVAWMYVNSEGECEQIEYGTEAIDDDSITPLYTAPPAAAPSEDVEALRRDAERYRWVRGEHSRIDPCIQANAKYRLERQSSTWVNIHDLDAAIDAAMQEDKP